MNEPIPSFAEMAIREVGLLERIVAGVLHEFAGPLGVLTTNSRLLEHARSQSSEVLRKASAPVKADVANVLGILESIQASQEEACARLTSTMQSLKGCVGLDEAEWKKIDVSRLLDCGVELLRNSSGRSIEIERDYQRGLEVDGAIHQLAQLFMHLLLNAMEDAGESGRVTVSARESDEDVTVRFKSSGSHAKRDGSRDAIAPPGAEGVGPSGAIAACRYVVKQHAGTMEIATGPGGGTTAQIALPKIGSPRGSEPASRAGAGSS